MVTELISGETASTSAVWFGLSSLGVVGKDKTEPTGSLAYVDGKAIDWAVNNYGSSTVGENARSGWEWFSQEKGAVLGWGWGWG